MKKNGFVPILIILIIITLGVVGYLGYKNYLSNPSSLKPIPTPVSTISFDISNWKTYTNTRYGYMFKYPQGTDISWPYEPDGYIFVKPKIENVSESMTMSIKHFVNPGSLTAKDFYNKLVADAQIEAKAKNFPAPIPPEGGTRETKINNIDAFQTLHNFVGDGGIEHTYLTDGKIIVDISFYDDLNNPNYPNNKEFMSLFDQILSTFKFTN